MRARSFLLATLLAHAAEASVTPTGVYGAEFTSHATRLRASLLDGYDMAVPPTSVRAGVSKAGTDVGLELNFFKVESVSAAHGHMRLKVWVRMTWSDLRLSWGSFHSARRVRSTMSCGTERTASIHEITTQGGLGCGAAWTRRGRGWVRLRRFCGLWSVDSEMCRSLGSNACIQEVACPTAVTTAASHNADGDAAATVITRDSRGHELPLQPSVRLAEPAAGDGGPRRRLRPLRRRRRRRLRQGGRAPLPRGAQERRPVPDPHLAHPHTVQRAFPSVHC